MITTGCAPARSSPGSKVRPRERANPQNIEELAGRDGSPHQGEAGFRAERVRLIRIGRHALEALGHALHEVELLTAPIVLRPKRDHSIFVRNRQRPDHEAVHHGEERGGATDAER
jgi:hypothetical protein